jgi:hypothetical protein
MTPHKYECSKYTLEIMSEELVARLRAGQCAERLLFAAADRIEGLLGDLKSVLSREAATQERHDNKMEALEAKLAKATAVEDAFCEGFAEGCDGTWVEGDYTHAWKKSHALANLEETK